MLNCHVIVTRMRFAENSLHILTRLIRRMRRVPHVLSLGDVSRSHRRPSRRRETQGDRKMCSGILVSLQGAAARALGFLMLGSLALAGSATAATVPVANGGTLTLTASNSGLSNNTVAATGNISAPAVPGSYMYGDGFSSNQTGHNFGSTSFGFYDDFVFTIGPGQADAVTSTISIGNLLGITNLQARIYNYTANGSVAPLLSTPLDGKDTHSGR